MNIFCLLICVSSAYQITVSDKDGETDLCKSVSTGIKKLERKMDKKLEKMVTTLQQSIDNKCSNEHLKEVAKGKAAQQSSTYKDHFPAGTAVDGNIGTFSTTQHEYNPYWWVDLGRIYRVKRIEVYSRKDCCGSRLYDTDVTVGPSLNNMSLCKYYKGPATTGEHVVLDCKDKMVGRYVKLVVKTGDKRAYMQIAEVKVFAYQ
ncbi:fucolectin-like [Mytilus trossulus]|uniref:fucolectin-like n=1 Tax=Mytilus trossulus TaxID=6551 RepID=UPI0030046274